jgi:hypothetical protein
MGASSLSGAPGPLPAGLYSIWSGSGLICGSWVRGAATERAEIPPGAVCDVRPAGALPVRGCTDSWRGLRWRGRHQASGVDSLSVRGDEHTPGREWQVYSRERLVWRRFNAVPQNLKPAGGLVELASAVGILGSVERGQAGNDLGPLTLSSFVQGEHCACPGKAHAVEDVKRDKLLPLGV